MVLVVRALRPDLSPVSGDIQRDRRATIYVSTATLFSLQLPQQPSAQTQWFSRFPRSVDLADGSRCTTALVAAIAARRNARSDKTAVVATITSLAADIGASPSHIGQRTLRHLEAEGQITRVGGGWTISPLGNGGWFKFPGWITNAGLSRSAIVVLLGICSSSYADDSNGRITVTYGQLRDKLGMNRSRVIQAVKELEAAGALIVHRTRAEGCHDYNNPNQYVVCYEKRVPKQPRRQTTVAWQRPTQQLIDRLMTDPQWAKALSETSPPKRYQRRVEQAVGRLANERDADELSRKLLGGRGLEGATNVWGVLCHRLDQMPLLEDRELAQAQAAQRRGEISPAQLQLVEQQVRSELELVSHTYRTE